MHHSAKESSANFCIRSREKEKKIQLWLLRAVSAKRITWLNDHYDDARATPSCASLMFGEMSRCHSERFALCFDVHNVSSSWMLAVKFGENPFSPLQTVRFLLLTTMLFFFLPK